MNSILVPSRSDVPKWVKSIKPQKFLVKDDHKLITPAEARNDEEGKYVRLDTIFDVRNGTLVIAQNRSEYRDSDDYVPYIRPSKLQTTSFVEYVDSLAVEQKFVFPRHTLYVSTNGQGSHTYSYVSTERFIPNTDVSPLIPKRVMSLQEKLFYAAVITAHRPLFSYGRKPKGERLKSLLLPQWAPQFIYEEDLIGVIAS